MSNIGVAYRQTSWCGINCMENERAHHHHEIPKETKTDQVDEILTQAMKHLSFDELQREQEELHGITVVNATKEDGDIEGMLMALEGHLNLLKPGTKFESAELINSSYVSRREFLVMFLSGNRYDPKAAAEQLIRHFDLKFHLFGQSKLTKDITLADLDADDISSLLSGSMQFLKRNDRSNRTIVLELPGLRFYKDLRNELRARFYLFMDMMQSIEDPSRGVCFISYCVDEFQDIYNGAGFVENMRLALAIPTNIGGMHLCISDPRESIIAKAAMTLMPARLRAKTKVHLGSHQECQYMLSTFGISRKALPFFDDTNDICLNDHKTWYHQRLSAENISANPTFNTLQPTNCDVVFNGRTTNGNGNERLRNLTIQYAPSYDSSNVEDKRRIVSTMMGNIQSNGGRFLKWSSTTEEWKEVPHLEVREKVCQMFRNLRRRAAQQQRPELPLQVVKDVSENDVLFGRRKEHPGNLRLRLLIESLAAEYDAASRGRKKQLTTLVIQEIEQNGGRFLEKVKSESWVELSRQALGDKLSSQFRNYRRRQKEKGLAK
ncbi:unnamed protein product [Cylindrotheca closterium]|uniref:DUF6824 domain-containing protein n=1 Tax=Cylindrotheca closterium TaxID=2856 RepID=A0AAD2CEU1_9STRA|nr:unnamed protein product [Cylindrotheca closterium]